MVWPYFLTLKRLSIHWTDQFLLEKIKYGILGNEWKWLASYLSDRCQYTVINGVSSDVLPVNFGVPQGGILSALAFLLYINDVINCDESADFILYADDTTIYLADENLGELYSKARDAASNFKLWCDSSKLTLNASNSN